MLNMLTHTYDILHSTYKLHHILLVSDNLFRLEIQIGRSCTSRAADLRRVESPRVDALFGRWMHMRVYYIYIYIYIYIYMRTNIYIYIHIS